MRSSLSVYFVYESPRTKNVSLQIMNFLVQLQQNSVEYRSFRLYVAKHFHLDKAVGYHESFAKASFSIASIGQILTGEPASDEQRLLIVVHDARAERLVAKNWHKTAISLIDRSGGNCVFLYLTRAQAKKDGIVSTEHNQQQSDDLPRNIPSGLYIDKAEPIELSLLWYQNGDANQVTVDSIINLCEILIETRPNSLIDWSYAFRWKSFPRAVLLHAMLKFEAGNQGHTEISLDDMANTVYNRYLVNKIRADPGVQIRAAQEKDRFRSAQQRQGSRKRSSISHKPPLVAEK